MNTNSAPFQPHRWIWIASIWLGFGLLDAMQTVLIMHSEGMHHAWVKLFMTTVFSWLPWALATTLVLRLGRRFPPVKLRPYWKWFVHTAACAAIGLTFAAWTTWLEMLFNPYAGPSPPGPSLRTLSVRIPLQWDAAIRIDPPCARLAIPCLTAFSTIGCKIRLGT